MGRTTNTLKSRKDEEWDILDRKEQGTIWICLEVLIDFNISKENTVADLMKELAKLYEKLLATNKVFLMKRLFNMKMLEGGNVANHLNNFNMVTN